MTANYFCNDLNKCGFSWRSISSNSFSNGITIPSISSALFTLKLLTGNLLLSRQKYPSTFSFAGFKCYFSFFCASEASLILRKASLWDKDLDFLRSSFITSFGSFPESNGSEGNCSTIGFISYKYPKKSRLNSIFHNSIDRFDLHLLLELVKSAFYPPIFWMQLKVSSSRCCSHIEWNKNIREDILRSPSISLAGSCEHLKFQTEKFYLDLQQDLSAICLFQNPCIKNQPKKFGWESMSGILILKK